MARMDEISKRRPASSARRLEKAGYRLARQVIAPALLVRARHDEALRRDLVPLRDLLRVHVFADDASRASACRAEMLGGAFELLPTSAEDLETPPRLECHLAVGPGVSEPSFSTVAPAVVDRDIDALLNSRGSRILTVAGVHYQLCVDDIEGVHVRAKAPFDAADESDVKATAAWIIERTLSRQEALEFD